MEGKFPKSEMKDFDLPSESPSGNYYSVVLYGDEFYILFVSPILQGGFIQNSDPFKNS